jgi:DNA-binding LacI/PurR family transcriptional regulator
LAVVVDDLTSPLALGFMRGAIAKAEAANYVVSVIELVGDPQERQTQLTRIGRQRIDAVLLAFNATAEHAGALRDGLASQPVVTFGSGGGLTADVFLPDQAEAGRIAVRHLANVAGNDLLYLHREGSDAAEARRAGAAEVMRERGIDADNATIAMSATADLAALDTISERIGGVTGIIASDDALAIQAMLLAERKGRRVGVDLAVVGQGNSSVSAQLQPALSTVDFAGDETGRRAVEVALQRISAARMDTATETAVTPILIERASSQLRR